jgi:ADP-ribose pyrophosphatase YjhB (NUDIX family)
MEKPLFYNIENKNIKVCYDDMKLDFWISRSIAVVGLVFAETPTNKYVLAVKRSEKMDNPFKWCLPCGYLDWNETCRQAMAREVYEETGLYLMSPNIIENTLTNNSGRPFRIQDDPNKDVKQNVSFSYVTVLNFSDENMLWEVEEFVNDEIYQVKWVPLTTDGISSLDWAFDHNSVIKDAEKFLNS